MTKAQKRDAEDKAAHDEVLKKGAEFLAAISNAEQRGLWVDVYKNGMNEANGFVITTRRPFRNEVRPVGKTEIKK